MATECNNKNKELVSRPELARIINYEFSNKAISMLELLGDGTGLDYYIDKCNIKTMYAIERHKDNFNKFCYRMKDFWLYPPLVLHKSNAEIVPLRIQLNKFFNNFTYISFDVVNLDFCSYLYDNGTEKSTGFVIRNMFKNKAVKDNGLVLFTFMVKGMGINFSKVNPITEDEDIIDTITSIGLENGYIVHDAYPSLHYKSSKSTEMANYIVRVNKI
jgi:hypothetical protein